MARDNRDDGVGYFQDAQVVETSHHGWRKTDMGWDIVPWGLHRLLLYIQAEYSPPGGILITENGCAVADGNVTAAVDDIDRVRFFQGYLSQVQLANFKELHTLRNVFASRR